MAKIVCKDCGEVIKRGVDPDDVDPDEVDHHHADPPAVSDERTDRGESAPDASAGGDDADGREGDAEPDVTPGPDADDEAPDGPEPEGDAGQGGDGGTRGGGGGTPEGAEPEADPVDPDAEATVRNDSADEVTDPDEGRTVEVDPEAELAEMDEADADRSSAGWYDVDGDTDYREVDEEFKRRYERIREEVRKKRSLAGDMAKTRDRGEDRYGSRSRYGAARLQQRDEWQEMRDDIIEAFSELKTRDRRQPARKGDGLNTSAIVQRAAGDKSQDKLFTRKDRIAKGDRLIGVSVDMSSSMNERAAKLSVAAICEAARVIGDDVIVNAWKGGKDANYGLNVNSGSIGLMVGPDETFEWDRLDKFETGGGTPTPDGIHNMRQLMEDHTAREKVMIVVTDGGANGNLSADGTRTTGNAVEDTARLCREIRGEGMKVIGLGVGYISEGKMGAQFGSGNYVTANMADLADKLLEVYRRQIDV